MGISNITDIAIITIKNIDYCCIIHNVSKSTATNFSKHSVLEDRGYISKWLIVNIVQTSFKSLNISIGTVVRNLEIRSWSS